METLKAIINDTEAALNRYAINRLQIEITSQELASLEDLKAGQLYDTTKKALETALNKTAEIIENCKSYNATIDKLIDQLPEDLAELMKLRFFDNKSWEEIEKQLHYSARSIFKKRSQAIELIVKAAAADLMQQQ